ncbi:MAG TPA: hypothetical protein VMU36_11290 [Spirochaetia bacterium]|nr:hypothetical protein [Spirochaetia bacterium]
MVWYLALILAIALLFYAALPGIGAFRVRGRWRVFRETVREVSRYPTATPHAVGRERNAFIGLSRFFGTLEAIQGEHRIWITNGKFSVAADLRNVHVYLIPEDGGQGEALPAVEDTELRSMPWNRIFSLPEGTPVFVGGALFSEEGRGVFREYGRARLLVVIHDCPRESIVESAIRGGRQRNEYMNPFTLPSVAIGSLTLILLAYSLLAAPEARILALVALTAGLAPVSPFLPPGFPLYFAYRRYWKKARLMRVQRDIIHLPMRYFAAATDDGGIRRTTLLPDREPYIMIRAKMRARGPEPSSPTESFPESDSLLTSDGLAVSLPSDIRRIDVELPPRAARAGLGSAEELVVFGAYRQEGETFVVSKPEDPMAEHVLLPGDPESISAVSRRVARMYTAVSVLFIILNAAINIPLMFVLLSFLIR